MRVLLAIVVMLLPVVAAAQEPAPGGIDIRDLATRAAERLPEPSAQVAFQTDCAAITETEVRERCNAAQAAYFAYRERGFAHRGKVFDWQYYSTVVIFAVVSGLVIAGVWFAWLQFRLDLRAPKDGEGAEPMHTAELSAKGIKVSSPVLGVIILALSLGFFYHYLVYVYPIQEVL
ncbi:MAG: hypothetical protein AAFV19_10875 [Pseudomonadota bacterium]